MVLLEDPESTGNHRPQPESYALGFDASERPCDSSDGHSPRSIMSRTLREVALKVRANEMVRLGANSR